MKKLSSFGQAFNKALTQFCTILGTITITHYLLTYYGLMDYWYAFALLATISATVVLITLGGINMYQKFKSICWKTFYVIPLTGITLTVLIILEPTLPYRCIGFMLFILMIGIPADMFINRKAHDFFGTLQALSKWDILTDITISGIAGYIISYHWSNALIVSVTLIIAYAIIILWNFSINSKGPKHTNNNAE